MFQNAFHLCILARTQLLFELPTLEQIEFSTLFQNQTLSPGWAAPRCEALLDITQDRKVLAAAQTHPILCKYLLSTLTFSLYTFKRHIIVTTRENIVNVNGSAMEADYGWLGAKQQFWLTYLLSLHIKTLWLLLISNHEWLLIGWSTFAQNFPDCFLQFYDIILLASHRKRIQFQHSTQFHCFIGADGNNGILILNLNWIL